MKNTEYRTRSKDCSHVCPGDQERKAVWRKPFGTNHERDEEGFTARKDSLRTYEGDLMKVVFRKKQMVRL